ncbi:MAG: response regulator [Campylobacterales bacterium]|nr:response regulator [Campylobacterales bacterium]
MLEFNPLLIHKDNTPLKTQVKVLEKFDIETFDFGNSDLDTYISKEFIPKILKREFNILFIKDNLSDNYLELYGIILAYHIRLSTELGDKRFVPIIIISDVDGYILNKLTPMANILFTKNTFVARNEIASYNYFEKVFEQIQPFVDFKKEFLDLIHIEPPQDYLSYHDITNEWSIYRWAEFLGVNTDATKGNKAKIENMLYFKYLKARFPIPKKTGIQIVPKTPLSQGNILYIDDEWDKGWKDIFKEYFSKRQNIKFHFINHQYKDTTYDAIQALVKDSLASNSIDTVMLDMRLTKEDHEQTNVKELSGVKLLELIKSFNRGIQVILFTASEKSVILDEANKYNILGYIKKESPSDEGAYTKTVFEKLKTLIDSGFERKYLKEIWNIQQEILKLDLFATDKYNEIKIEIESIFVILETSMKNKLIYAMFALFKSIEIIIGLYIEEKKDGRDRYAYWINTNDKIPYFNKDNFLEKTNLGDSNDSTKNKIRVLLHEKLNIKDENMHDNITSLVEIRNKTIHPKRKEDRAKQVTDDDILTWFKLLQTILSKLK